MYDKVNGGKNTKKIKVGKNLWISPSLKTPSPTLKVALGSKMKISRP